jgi:protein ImuB
MEGFLRARGGGVNEFHIDIIHSKEKTRLTIGSARPERDPIQLLTLTKERLSQKQLPASVIGLRIKAESLISFECENESWLPDSQRQNVHLHQLIDRLRARLGNDQVYFLGAIDDHRPEAAWKKLSSFGKESCSPIAHQPRPLFLLPNPRPLLSNEQGPLFRGALTLLTSPERIESGWWEGKAISRDYYVARNPVGETMWIFQEHSNKQWFLHGYYA